MSFIGEHAVDRLSSLPQDVLSYIISLMPTKSAVRTSLLSKTWRYTWTFVHYLNFDTIEDDHKYLYPKDVDWVLERCKIAQVKIFRVHFSCYSNSESYWRELISKAIGLNVPELDMKGEYLKLPTSLFTYETLTKLKLDYIKTSFSCPSFVNLPNLKTLDIVIQGQYWESALKLIHGCPVLEHLYVKMDCWNNEGGNYFNIPTLKRLNLKVNASCSESITNKVVLNFPSLEYFLFDGFMDFPFVIEEMPSLISAKASCVVCPSFFNLPNLKTLDVVIQGQCWGSALKLIHGCPLLEHLYVKMDCWNNEGGSYFNIPTLKRLKLKVNASCSESIRDNVVLNLPNLEYFLFDGFLDFSFVIEEMPSLISAKASCVVCHGDRLVQLLNAISEAKSITLNIEDWSHGENHLDLPMFFPNLKQLELEGYVGPQSTLLLQFLERSPKLEHLSIGTDLHDCRWNKLKSIPTCMRVNLKTVKYTNGRGYLDLEFLKFILSYSKVLKTLTVECDTRSRMLLRANLIKLRKASIKGKIRLQFRSPINKTRTEPTGANLCTTTLAHMNTAFEIVLPIYLYCSLLFHYLT